MRVTAEQEVLGYSQKVNKGDRGRGPGDPTVAEWSSHSNFTPSFSKFIEIFT